MTAQLPSRELLQKIIETANGIITVNNGTNEDISKNDTNKIIGLYDYFNDNLASPSVVKALAEFALAAHEQEPVGTFRKTAIGYAPSYHEDAVPLYARPAPVPAVPDDKLYARPQSASVDLPNLEVSTLLKIMSGEIRGNATVAANLARHLLKAMSVPKATKQTMRTWFPSLSDYECVVAADVWNACRAAMLDGGKS